MKLITYQRGHGTQRLVAKVLAENASMLQLAQSLGFSLNQQLAESGTWHIQLALQR